MVHQFKRFLCGEETVLTYPQEAYKNKEIALVETLPDSL